MNMGELQDRERGWWALQGSNLRHSACKADALPTELSARKIYSKHSSSRVTLNVVSSQCSLARIERLLGGYYSPALCSGLLSHLIQLVRLTPLTQATGQLS